VGFPGLPEERQALEAMRLCFSGVFRRVGNLAIKPDHQNFSQVMSARPLVTLAII